MQLAGAALFIGVFGFLAVAAWAAARASERQTQARYALLAKAAEQPTESAKAILEFLREDEARRDRERAVRTRRDGLQSGAVIVAVGLGLSTFLYYLLPNNATQIWPVGLMLIFVGLVVFGFAFLNRPKS